MGEVRGQSTVGMVKQRIQAVEGTAVQFQRLLFADRQLDDEDTLSGCGNGPRAFLRLVLQLKGGMPGPTQYTGSDATDVECPVCHMRYVYPSPRADPGNDREGGECRCCIEEGRAGTSNGLERVICVRDCDLPPQLAPLGGFQDNQASGLGTWVVQPPGTAGSGWTPPL